MIGRSEATFDHWRCQACAPSPTGCGRIRSEAEKGACAHLHRPHIIRSDRRLAIIPELRLDSPFERLVAQLQARLPVKPVNLRHVHLPTVPAQDIESSSLVITDTHLAELSNALLQQIRIGGAGQLMITGSVERQCPAGHSGRHASV